MLEIRGEFNGLDDVLAYLDRLGEQIEQGKRVPMQQSLDVVEQAVAVRTPVNIGALRGSLQTTMRGQGVDLHGIMFSPLEYAVPVERGRRPGKMPPRDAIRYWVIRKNIADGPEADRVAFAIAMAIAKGTSKGTANKGAHMFRDGWQEASPHIPGIWLRWLRGILGRAK